MKRQLGIYLNDHLAGSAVGLALAERLSNSATDLAERLCLAHLLCEIRDDRDELLAIIKESGCEIDKLRQRAGTAFSRPVLWRMASHGLGFGELGRFEMIELLGDGILAKRQLWRTLREVVTDPRPGSKGTNLKELENRATSQFQSLEIYRRNEAAGVFSDCENIGRQLSIKENLQAD